MNVVATCKRWLCGSMNGRYPISVAIGVACACSRSKPSEQPAPHAVQPAPPDSHKEMRTPYASIVDALQATIPADADILGFGELHERNDHQSKRSALAQFTDIALPALAQRSAYLIVETWSAPDGCGSAAKQVTKDVETAVARPVTTKSEVALLADAAKANHVVPVQMNFSCADYASLTNAGRRNSDDQIILMLDLTVRELRAQLTAGITKVAQRSDQRRRIILYGGGLHNDRAPAQGTEMWSYAASMTPAALQHYVEIDWYPRGLAYSDNATVSSGLLPPIDDQPSKVWVIKRAVGSYVILLPE
jgi:hypothetical protein